MFNTPQRLNEALNSGKLFNYESDMAMLRAWGHSERESPEVKPIMDKKASEFQSEGFKHWVHMLTKVNLYLTSPVIPPKAKEEATLSDYLELEEVILSQYINQIRSEKEYTGVHSLPPYIKVEIDYEVGMPILIGPASKFLRDFPQYSVDDEVYQFSTQPEDTRLEIHQWESRAPLNNGIETKKPLDMEYIFAIGGPLTLGIFIILQQYFISTVYGATLLILWLTHCLKSWNKKPQSETLPAVIRKSLESRILESINKKFINHISNNWTDILKPSDKLEHKFLLRVYFNLMHKESLYDLNSFPDTARVDLSSMRVDYFVKLVVYQMYSYGFEMKSNAVVYRLFEYAEFK